MSTDHEIREIKTRLAVLEGEVLAYQNLFAGFLSSLPTRNNLYVSRLQTGVTQTSQSLAQRPEARARFDAVSKHLLQALSISMPPR